MLEPPGLSKNSKSSSDQSNYIHTVNDPFANLNELKNWFKQARKASFLLCNAGTKVSELAGISAAGADAAARRLTPALDSEALILGKTISAERLPVSPIGIVSPVVISRACLQLLQIEAKVIDCGSFASAKIKDLLELSSVVADCPSSGQALPERLVAKLFQDGQELGNKYSENNDYIVVAECVPGGTTTAMAVMSALGYEINGLVSSSLPSSNHSQRWDLVSTGLAKSGYSRSDFRKQPLLAVSSVGDAMQAVVAGIASSAAKRIRVFLAGGSQMLAIWGLLKALALPQAQLERITIMTTGWVAFDKSAGVQKLAQIMNAPMAAACPNFWNSRHPGLQAYEEGNVKEGVGAGACMCLAHLYGFTARDIQSAIDTCYDELLAKSFR